MRTRMGLLIMACASGVAILGCGAARAGGLPAAPAASRQVLDSGEASWYGPRHTGLRTFSGERFDPRQMTAAHASLPIGTLVRVTDMATGRSVIVRVNDREPPHGVRCIDLSEGAATRLGMHARGLAEVTLTSVLPEDTAPQTPVEVAEAPDGNVAIDAPPARHHGTTGRHGRRHRHHAAQ